MRILLAPDSFKGSLSSLAVCNTVKALIGKEMPDCTVDCIPVADGGEGTVDSFAISCGAQRCIDEVTAPDYEITPAEFAIMGDTAVIETAQASGLPLVGAANDPLHATTYGSGELIKSALDMGCRKIVLGIGGSATNDGGIGLASALGALFTDEDGEKVTPDGLGMSKISNIDLSGLDPRLSECVITVLCDVENPLYGENGAAYVFAPQKGADEEKVIFLDNALRNLEKAVKKCMGIDCAADSGSGAAGGMGYGLKVFLGAKLQSGAKTVLDLCDFDERAKKTDIIITGEGRFDRQSLMGKVPGEIISRANDKPVAVLCGMSLLEKADGVCRIFETNPDHLPFEQVLPYCRKMLEETVKKEIIPFLKIFSKKA